MRSSPDRRVDAVRQNVSTARLILRSWSVVNLVGRGARPRCRPRRARVTRPVSTETPVAAQGIRQHAPHQPHDELL
jgi:hypothetical protein